VQPYLAADAWDIVRSYLSEIMRECSMRLYDASRIAKHLTMLGSRHVVEDRVLRERRLKAGSDLIDPLLGGVLEGVIASGDVGEIETAFTALEKSGLALAHLYWGVNTYSESPQNFAIELVLSKAMSLYMRYGHLEPRIGVSLTAHAVDRRLSTVAAAGLEAAEQFLVQDTNRNHDRYDILFLASLQLLALQSGSAPDVLVIAARIQRDHERQAFLSLCVDAFVALGRLDEARAIAELIPHSASNQVDVGFLPSNYAWTRIAEGLARQGKLVEAFTLGVLEKKATSLDRLVEEWEAATGVHLSKRPPIRSDN
jgi:hypothetical protein